MRERQTNTRARKEGVPRASHPKKDPRNGREKQLLAMSATKGQDVYSGQDLTQYDSVGRLGWYISRVHKTRVSAAYDKELVASESCRSGYPL